MKNRAAYQALLQSCEEDLRRGRPLNLTKALGAAGTSKIPRPLRCGFANVCRRAGLYKLGLQILAPVVRPQEAAARTPSAEEIGEYAILLLYIGSVREAMAWLQLINSGDLRQLSLYRAFCHFRLWDAEAAVPELEAYLLQPLAEYERLVGQVNLVAALLGAQRIPEALELQTVATARARDLKAVRLEANLTELKAQILFSKGKNSLALKELERGARLLANDGSADQSFIEKWRTIILATQTSDTTDLLNFKRQAEEKAHWENAREAELFCAKIQPESERHRRLFFGTPFRAYRKRIELQLGPLTDLRPFEWGVGEVLDLESGEFRGETILEAGSLVHRLFVLLCKDFYRPLKLGELFAELYPGEHFDADTSPDRIYQSLRLLRRWSERLHLPLKIIVQSGHFRLFPLEPLAIRLMLDREPQSAEILHLRKLGEAFHQEAFTAAEACARLGLSRSQFKRLASGSGETLIRSGSGSQTRYRIASAGAPKIETRQ